MRCLVRDKRAHALAVSEIRRQYPVRDVLQSAMSAKFLSLVLDRDKAPDSQANKRKLFSIAMNRPHFDRSPRFKPAEVIRRN